MWQMKYWQSPFINEKLWFEKWRNLSQNTHIEAQDLNVRLALELFLLSRLSGPQVLHSQDEGLGWNGVSWAVIFHVLVDFLQPSPGPGVFDGPGMVACLHGPETRLVDPSPDLLPLRDPSVVYWEHPPPHSAAQAERFLPISTLSRLILTSMATQPGRAGTSAGHYSPALWVWILAPACQWCSTG